MTHNPNIWLLGDLVFLEAPIAFLTLHGRHARGNLGRPGGAAGAGEGGAGAVSPGHITAFDGLPNPPQKDENPRVGVVFLFVFVGETGCFVK